MKTYLLIASLFVALLVVLSLIPKSVLADGMMIKPDPYSDRWDYSNETNQQAFINYANGLQKMILSIGMESYNNDGTVWLFPVPADPQKVVIDIVKTIPGIRGEEISKTAQSRLSDIAKSLQATQLYPILFWDRPTSYNNNERYISKVNTLSIDIDLYNPQDVVVYEHLEKEGITTEIITAKTTNGLFDYLKSKGLNIEKGTIPVLDTYIGKEYTFIASWIDSSKNPLIQSLKDPIVDIIHKCGDGYRGCQKFNELFSSFSKKYPDIAFFQAYYSHMSIQQFEASYGVVFSEFMNSILNDPSLIFDLMEWRKDIGDIIYGNNNLISASSKQRGVFVMFPTKDIYFPLIPTSVYGSKIVPATIKVMGHVSPKVFQDIKEYTQVNYYIGGNDNYHNTYDDEDVKSLKSFYGAKNTNMDYTKIEINAPSKFFTDDLWISNQAPLKTYYSAFVARHPIIMGLILLIVSSIMAGILVGWVIFRDLRKNWSKLAIIGLSNCFSILGLLITTVFVGTKHKNDTHDSLLAEIKQKGYFWRRRTAMILFFLTIPFLILGLSEFHTIMRSIWYFLAGRDDYIYSLRNLFFVLLLYYVFPILGIIIGFAMKRIKMEDRNLFKQLKVTDYSTLSFQSKDIMKIVFVPLFSITYLIISWLLVGLVEFTV